MFHLHALHPPHFAALLTDVHVCACCSAWLYDDTVTLARISDRCAALTNLTLDSVEALQVDRSRTSRRTHVSQKGGKVRGRRACR